MWCSRVASTKTKVILVSTHSRSWALCAPSQDAGRQLLCLTDEKRVSGAAPSTRSHPVMKEQGSQPVVIGSWSPAFFLPPGQGLSPGWQAGNSFNPSLSLPFPWAWLLILQSSWKNSFPAPYLFSNRISLRGLRPVQGNRALPALNARDGFSSETGSFESKGLFLLN